MAGPNTSGQNQPKDYNLGRGVVYIAELDVLTLLPDVNGYRDLGNAPEFNITPTEEVLQHFSSRRGLKTLDREVTMSQQIGGSFNLDEFNDENLAVLFNGDQNSFPNPTVLGFAAGVLADSAKLGRWYDIIDDITVPLIPGRAYDVPSVSVALTVAATPLVEGIDFILDEKMGRVFFLETAADVADGDQVDITVTATPGAAATIEEVRAHTTEEKTYALKFIAENPNNRDKQSQYLFHKVQLKSQTDLSLIGDDWSQMTLTFSAERNALADPNSPVLTITSHANS